MGKKKLLEMQVKDFNEKVLAISKENPDLRVRPTTRNMYSAYVERTKAIFPKNEEVKKLREITAGGYLSYADLSNLIGQLVALLDFLLKE